MNGIKFLFWNGKQKFFGDCKGAVVTQEFSKTAVITGIVEVKSGGKEGNGEKPFGGMKRIMVTFSAPWFAFTDFPVLVRSTIKCSATGHDQESRLDY